MHIPLSNIPRADLALRTEMTAVLGGVGLAPSDLLTLSELPDQLRPEDTRWLLVDHNSLTGPLSRFSGQVTGCIDHHADEDVIPRGASPRIIEPCGSCMSLVIEESKGLWEELASRDDDVGAEQGNLAKLGLSAILIDTINLTAEAKIKEKDRTATAFLEGKLQGSQYDRTNLFQDISSVKEDISSLDFRDILRKDYKEWTEGSVKIGISSVPQGLDYLVDEKAHSSVDDFIAAVGDWAGEKELDLVSVMTTSHPDGEFRRDLFVWARSDAGERAVQKFVEEASGELQLETYAQGRLDGGKGRAAWRQHNLAASRKQVAPLIREAAKKA
jgi:exopolyphosphatase